MGHWEEEEAEEEDEEVRRRRRRRRRSQALKGTLPGLSGLSPSELAGAEEWLEE